MIGMANLAYNLEKAFDGTPWRPAKSLPVARELGQASLMFLTHPTLTDQEVDRMIKVVDTVLSRAALNPKI